MTTAYITETLIGVHCNACGVLFGLEESHRQRLKASHETFYCPSGHPLHFPGQAEVERLKAELEQMTTFRNNAQADRDCQRELKEAARRSLIALRGHTTRLKKRVAKGACPCCHAKFKDLASHMAEQHPTYAENP